MGHLLPGLLAFWGHHASDVGTPHELSHLGPHQRVYTVLSKDDHLDGAAMFKQSDMWACRV